MTGTPLIVEGFFAVGAHGAVTLLGHRCGQCDVLGFPRAATCGSCGGDAPDPVALGATGGALFGWTDVTIRPPGYAGDVPFGFGIVELDEGLRVIGRLVGEVAGFTFGQRMVCVADPVATVVEPGPAGAGSDEPRTETRAVWAFAPEPGGPR